jgi:carboxymethylenebutenolidase
MSFAAATAPVADTVVHTPATGLHTGWVHWPATHGGAPGTAPHTLRAYSARPEGPPPPGGWPVVLVVQEIFGVHEHIQDVTRRLAHAGCLAVAPDLFGRLGDPAVCQTYEELRNGFIWPTPDAQVMADLDDAMRWALAQGGNAARVHLTGFCWGGRIAWLYAAHQPALASAVAWYGRLQGPTSALQPEHPQQVAPRLKAPVLGLYGACDEGIPLAHVQAMQAALAARVAGPEGQTQPSAHIEVFAGAPHAFMADYRPSYRAADAARGWQLMLQWMTRAESTRQDEGTSTT